jgi:hypothetical protein
VPEKRPVDEEKRKSGQRREDPKEKGDLLKHLYTPSQNIPTDL